MQFQLRPYLDADADDLEVLEVCLNYRFVEDVGADVAPRDQRLLAVAQKLQEHESFIVSDVQYPVQFQLLYVIRLLALVHRLEYLHGVVPVVVRPEELDAVEPPFAQVRICHSHYYAGLVHYEWIVLFDTAGTALQEAGRDDDKEGSLTVERVVYRIEKRRNHQQKCNRD